MHSRPRFSDMPLAMVAQEASGERSPDARRGVRLGHRSLVRQAHWSPAQTMQRVGSFLMVLAATAARRHVADEDTMPFGSTRR
jgi:hypothetical protein